VFDLLARDLQATVGTGHEAIVEESAARIRLFTDDGDPSEFEARVVDDVQERLQGGFIDTSWPRCPTHPNHPLWFRDGWWTCQQSGTRFSRLGELSQQRT
jgi:hypothetical protein